MNAKFIAVLLVCLSSASFSAKSVGAFISLDDCEFIVPEGYFVNSGSIRDSGVSLISGYFGEKYGAVGIRHGVGNLPETFDEDGFEAQVLEQHQEDYYRYYVLRIRLPGTDEYIRSVRVETQSYTLTITGHAKDIWRENLVCPAGSFAR